MLTRMKTLSLVGAGLSVGGVLAIPDAGKDEDAEFSWSRLVSEWSSSYSRC